MSQIETEQALHDFGIDLTKLRLIAPRVGEGVLPTPQVPASEPAAATLTTRGTVYKVADVGDVGGAPTQAQFNALLAALRAAGVMASSAVAEDLVITNAITTAARVGDAYSFTPTTVGGSGTKVWSISVGTLPTGLSLNTGTGAITGTPTTAQSSAITLRVQDGQVIPDVATVSATIVVAAAALPLLQATGTPPGGQVGVAYSFTPGATGGQTPYVWTIAGGVLPTGLSISSATGAITGTPSVAGPYSFSLRVTDSQLVPDTDDLPCSINVGAAAAALAIAGSPPNAVEGEQYNWQAVVTNGVPPYSLSLFSGALPTGLTIDAANCAINGTTSVVGGALACVLRATDSVGATANLSTSITVVDNGAVDGSDAAFNSAVVPTGMTLSSADFVFTKTSAVGAFIGLDGHKSANRYWVEFEGLAGTGVEYCGIGVVNTLYDATTQPGVGANATRGLQIYEESTRGTYAVYYNGAEVTTFVLGGGAAMNTGAIIGAEYDNTARKFYPFIKPFGGSFQWIAGNPNTNPELGVAYGMSGDAAPCAGAFYNDCSFRARTAAECTESSNRRAGTTIGWKDSSSPSAPVLNIYGSVNDGTQDSAYGGFTPTVVGGTGPYTFAISAGALPGGLSLNASTGAVTGTPTTPGQYSFTIRVTDNVAATDTLVVYMAVAAAGVTPPAGNFLFNQSKAVHTPSYAVVPSKNASIDNVNTGARVKRVTQAATDTAFTSGALVVYSRYPVVNSNSQYVVIHGENSTSSWVIRRSDGVVVNNNLRHTGGQSIGEVNEIRWDYTGSFPNRVYYVYNKQFCMLDVITGVATLVRDFSADFPTADYIANDVEGDSSNDSDYWCWMAMVRASSGPYYPVAIFSYRKSTNAILGTITSATGGVVLGSDSGAATGGRMTRPNMVEAVPDGSGIVIHWARTYAGLNNNLTGTHQDGPHFYPNAITIGSAKKVAVDATHSGWARVGATWYFVAQNNRNDWIEACDLTNGWRDDGVNVIRMINHGDLGWNNGFHFSKMFTKLGWILCSTYSSSNSSWGDNQMIMLKIEPNCEVLRVAPTYTQYPGNDAYRNESQGAVDMTGNIIHWTSNFGGNFDRREVVEVVLPNNWESGL